MVRFKETGNMAALIYWRATYYTIGKGWGLGVPMESLPTSSVTARMIETTVIGFALFRKKGIYRCGREKERENRLCFSKEKVLGTLSGAVRGTGVDQPLTLPNCSSSLAREVSRRLRRNSSLRAGQEKCCGI